MYHQKDFQEEIIIFTRYPLAGNTKTRLIPELGAEGAAEVQRSMTEKIAGTAKHLQQDNRIRLSIYFVGGSHQQMKKWLGPGFFYHAQTGSDLGLKMLHAFKDSRGRGSERTVLIGSDCPAIDRRVLRDALTALTHSQLILGPTADGGYYLIGMNNRLPAAAVSQLFNDIDWGASNVFQVTLDRAKEKGIRTATLKQLHDIDTPQDLTYFHHHPDPQ